VAVSARGESVSPRAALHKIGPGALKIHEKCTGRIASRAGCLGRTISVPRDVFYCSVFFLASPPPATGLPWACSPRGNPNQTGSPVG